MKKAFIDASSAILLYKSDLFAPLLNAWQIIMSPEVFREITKTGYPGAAYFLTLGKKTHDSSARIILQEPGPADHPLFLLKNFMAMDKGEKETIQIFCNHNGVKVSGVGVPDIEWTDPGGSGTDPHKAKDTCAFVLVDDGRAARFCHAQQIPFINALLVPKIFWYSGFMDQKKYLKKTARLCELGRYSKRIMEMAGQFSRKELSYFIEGDSHER